MKKDYSNNATPCQISDEDMALINNFAVKPLTKEQVFTFNVALCDNEVDRDLERFDDDALVSLTKLFEGKTGIADHSMKSNDQNARIFRTELVTDSAKKTSLGEEFKYIKAKAYIPVCRKNEDLINDIITGIKKEVSINCSVRDKVCSICGKKAGFARCEHTKGVSYNGRICHHILKNPTDAYEWSFVAVPAQRGAGVIKSFLKTKGDENHMTDIFHLLKSCDGDITLSKSQTEEILKRMDELESLSKEAGEYKDFLKKDVIRLSCTVIPGISPESMDKICSSLPVSELKKLKDDLSSAVDRKDYSPLLSGKSNASGENKNNEFII